MKLQFAVSRASLIFQKRFPDAVSIYERLNIVSTSCTRSHIATTKQTNNNLKNTKKLSTEIILRCTPCTYHTLHSCKNTYNSCFLGRSPASGRKAKKRLSLISFKQEASKRCFCSCKDGIYICTSGDVHNFSSIQV